MSGKAQKSKDRGLEVVRDLHAKLQIEPEWCLWDERGFRWWGKDLAQRIWADPEAKDTNGEPFHRLHACTDVFDGFDDSDRQIAVLNALNQNATLSAFFADDERPGRVQLRCSMLLYPDNAEYVRLVFSTAVALWLFEKEGFFTPVMTPPFAALFLGAAMSITASPMLARMIVEHRLTGTAAGTIALTAGSLDDAAAWILLAAVVGGISGNSMLFAMALGGGVAYAIVCGKVFRPMLAFMDRHLDDRTTVGMVALLLAAGAWFTDVIGLYSVFGAFILGMAVPRGGLAEKTTKRVGPFASAFLLPVFFTYSGLNTRIGLVDSPFLWAVTAIIILAAIGGKLGACYAAARLSGSSHSDSLTVASLMNARGLMELILLNIALQAGLITPTLFTIMVIMAIVTTLMAAPGFNLARRWRTA